MAMLFAATYPERTLALALYATFAKRVWSPDYPWAPTPDERQRWMDLLEADWGGKTDLDTLAPSVAHDQAFISWWGTYLRLGASPGAALSLARFNTQTDVRAVLPAISAPTLVLHRKGDLDVDVEEARYLAARIPAARLVELDGDDHLIYTGDADRVVDEAQAFFSRHVSVEAHAERLLATVLSVAATSHDQAREATALLDRTVALYRGRRVGAEKLEATFDGPERAIRCACVLMAAGSRHGDPKGRHSYGRVRIDCRTPKRRAVSDGGCAGSRGEGRRGRREPHGEGSGERLSRAIRESRQPARGRCGRNLGHLRGQPHHPLTHRHVSEDITLVRAACRRPPFVTSRPMPQGFSRFPRGCRSRSATSRLLDDAEHPRCGPSASRVCHLIRFR